MDVDQHAGVLDTQKKDGVVLDTTFQRLKRERECNKTRFSRSEKASK